LDVIIFILKWVFVGILIAIGWSIGSELVRWIKREIKHSHEDQQLLHSLKALDDEMKFNLEVLPRIKEWIELNPGVDEKQRRQEILDALKNAGMSQKAEEFRRHWEKN